jgi:hypothetical protein
MYRSRLRQAPGTDELAQLYPAPHDHRVYGYGHQLRVEATISLGRWLAQEVKATSVADLSCGNAAVALDLGVSGVVYLGDLAAGYPITGPIEETLDLIPDVDLFVCGETIEHLADPDATLVAIRSKARALLLSTPIGDTGGNVEHVWGWDQEAVGAMLVEAEWTVAGRLDLILPDTYSYQIWAAR